MADTHDYDLVRGDCLQISIVYKDSDNLPVDLTGKGAIIAFACETAVPPVEYEITDATGVTLGGVDGTIEGTVPNATTKDALVGKKKSIYQVILTDSPSAAGCRTTILHGYVNFVESAAELAED